MWLSQPVDPKAKTPVSRRDHYAQLAKSGIKKGGEEVPFPDKLAYLYKWYKELSWHSLAPSEIKAYFDCMDVKPKHWEVELLLALDRDTKSD